ncbi:copper homeostasis protein [Lysobacteraceae bacterium NML03-0222]|nr:copper homeostasis protein [Xanthomonadaceae bacterium NML03-0222]PJK02726.1 copper homeostasis protein [Xanthomonadaceae bacterium NML71-0210]
MKKFALPLAIAATLSLAACKQTEAPAQAPAEPAAQAAAPAAAAPAQAPAAAEQSLAGMFKGTLACASCPGIETALSLNADGTYTLEQTYLEEQDGHKKTTGKWMLNEGRVALTPDGATEADTFYAVDSNDALTQVSADGSRSVNTELNYTLKRS